MITVGSDPHRFATLKMLDISFIISCVWLQSINRGFTPHSCTIYNITYPFHNPTFSRSIPRTSTRARRDVEFDTDFESKLDQMFALKGCVSCSWICCSCLNGCVQDNELHTLFRARTCTLKIMLALALIDS